MLDSIHMFLFYFLSLTEGVHLNVLLPYRPVFFLVKSMCIWPDITTYSPQCCYIQHLNSHHQYTRNCSEIIYKNLQDDNFNLLCNFNVFKWMFRPLCNDNWRWRLNYCIFHVWTWECFVRMLLTEGGCFYVYTHPGLPVFVLFLKVCSNGLQCFLWTHW